MNIFIYEGVRLYHDNVIECCPLKFTVRASVQYNKPEVEQIATVIWSIRRTLSFRELMILFAVYYSLMTLLQLARSRFFVGY